MKISNHQNNVGRCKWINVSWLLNIFCCLKMEKIVSPHIPFGEGTGTPLQYWKIPWMEEPGRLQSMGSLRVRHNWASSLSLFTFMHWRRKWQPTPVFLPGESQGWGTWWAAVYGVAQSRTRLKQLSSSSSSFLKCHFICLLYAFKNTEKVPKGLIWYHLVLWLKKELKSPDREPREPW